MNQYPRGKLNAEDEGELSVAITVNYKTVIVDFGKSVTWIGLDRDSATALAHLLLKRAAEIK